MIVLDSDELRALTGKCQHKSQRRELDIMGIPYLVRGDGSVAVVRAHVEQTKEDEGKIRKSPGPNWAGCL